VEPSRRTTSLPSTVAADALAHGDSETVEGMSWMAAYVRIGPRRIREEPQPISGASRMPCLNATTWAGASFRAFRLHAPY